MPKPAKGKKYVKVVKNKETGRKKKISYGDSKAKIAPGTKKGDAYCARSAKIKGDWKKDPNTVLRLLQQMGSTRKLKIL